MANRACDCERSLTGHGLAAPTCEAAEVRNFVRKLAYKKRRMFSDASRSTHSSRLVVTATLRGAIELSRIWDGQIIGCPGTIDNDLIGTDFTIGFSTAVKTAVDAVDKIRDTAESHERMFLIEVMGRHSGFIAVHTALAASAETICIPETVTDMPQIVEDLQRLKDRGKTSTMMIVAEGDENGGAETLNEQLTAAGCPFSTRVVVLGHLQRGGTPTSEDRLLASRLGRHAVASILDGETGAMAGILGGHASLTPFAEAVDGHKPIPIELLELVELLAQ